MRIPAVRKLCTLSSYFLSHTQHKPKNNVSALKTSLPSQPQHHFNSDLPLSALKLNVASPTEDSFDPDGDTTQLSSILFPPPVNKLASSGGIDDAETGKIILEKSLMADPSNGDAPLKRKEVSRERKQKWIFKHTSDDRVERLLKICGRKLGATATVDVFSQLGRETGLKEYNGLINLCIKKARETADEYVAIEEISKAFHLFKLMRECGFQLDEQTYRPLLQYTIDMGMVQEFQLLTDIIKDDNPRSVSRLGYYEMMLWIKVNNEEMIRDICEYITVEDSQGTFALRANYLLALCESDRKTQILDVLKSIDRKMFTSAKSIAKIFQSLGRLLLESHAENLLLDLRVHDHDADSISYFIASYAVSIPNLAAEDVVSKFKYLHEELEVLPSSSSYERLITYCCDIPKVDVALDIVEKMCEAGFTPSAGILQSIVHICEETYDYILVRRIYSIIRHHHLELNDEICRCLVNFCVRIKDFEGAYKMVDDLQEMNFKPTSAMYNAIMAGYFREKNIRCGLKVLKHMQDSNVKPNSQTFAYLITNCDTEDDINKCFEELEKSHIEPTKQVFMALINAYAACGNLEKAKKVVLDRCIPLRSINEIKSVLVSSLASHGHLSEALVIYKEIKKAGDNLEPKAVIGLIEVMVHLSGELEGLLLLLDELSDPDYWVDGCFRVILYCVQNNILSSAVDLFKKLKHKLGSDDTMMEVLFDAVFCFIATSGSKHLQFGLDLLWAIKDELGLVPSRQCLDFLLSACTSARELNNARLIWREYEIAGFPYNVLSYLRMYQTLLACGDQRSADLILKKISRDDAEVCYLIHACQKTYSVNIKSVGEPKTKKVEKKKKKKKKKIKSQG